MTQAALEATGERIRWIDLYRVCKSQQANDTFVEGLIKNQGRLAILSPVWFAETIVWSLK